MNVFKKGVLLVASSLVASTISGAVAFADPDETAVPPFPQNGAPQGDQSSSASQAGPSGAPEQQGGGPGMFRQRMRQRFMDRQNQGGEGGGSGPGAFAEERAKWQAIEPTLTPDQKMQIKQIREEGRQNTQPLREQAQALKEKMNANPPPDNMADLQAQMKTLHQQMKAQHEATQQKVSSVLTPQQRAQLNAAPSASQ
jgi:Spy/CpxP family protein refolding chaperone